MFQAFEEDFQETQNLKIHIDEVHNNFLKEFEPLAITIAEFIIYCQKYNNQIFKKNYLPYRYFNNDTKKEKVDSIIFTIMNCKFMVGLFVPTYYSSLVETKIYLYKTQGILKKFSTLLEILLVQKHFDFDIHSIKVDYANADFIYDLRDFYTEFKKTIDSTKEQLENELDQKTANYILAKELFKN